MICLYYLWAP